LIVSDVIARVRSTFGDAAAVQVQDDDIKRWINDAQIEIIKYNDSALQKSAFINLVAAQAQYTLPTDLLILRSLRYKYTSMLSYNLLRYQSMQQFDESIDGWDGTTYAQGTPQFFTKDEGKIILFPVPDQSATAGLKVVYNQQPTDVVGLSDALSLPLIYHNVINKYCMWQASLLDEDHEPALMYKSDFQDDVNRLMANETKDPVATYPTITVLEYDQ